MAGRATRDLISMHLTNTVDGYCDGVKEYCERLYDFLEKNLIYVKEQIKKNDRDIYWRHVQSIAIPRKTSSIFSDQCNPESALRNDRWFQRTIERRAY